MFEKLEVNALKPIASYLRPDLVIDKAHNLTVDALDTLHETKPVGLIIFDVDSTLEDYWRKKEPNDPDQKLLAETIELLERLRSAGFTLAIASNCDDVRGEELKRIFKGLVDVIATPKDAREHGARWGKKPTTGMYEYIQIALSERKNMNLRFSPSQTLMVGDQLLKDVLFGRRAHVKTILTDKFGEHDHPSVEKYQREHERRLLLAMGLTAVDGQVVFPSKLTPTKEWVKAQSGLILPAELAETDEY